MLHPVVSSRRIDGIAAYPALDDNPTAVFWRDGVLQPGCEGGSRQVLQAEV